MNIQKFSGELFRYASCYSGDGFAGEPEAYELPDLIQVGITGLQVSKKSI
jgi:hypothetical protein